MDIELYTPEQIAKRLKVSRDCVYKWCKRGVLPHHKLEGSVRISLEDVRDLLARCRVGGTRGGGPTC